MQGAIKIYILSDSSAPTQSELATSHYIGKILEIFLLSYYKYQYYKEVSVVMKSNIILWLSF